MWRVRSCSDRRGATSLAPRSNARFRKRTNQTTRRLEVKKSAKRTGKRGKGLTAGKKLQKTKTLTTLSGPASSTRPTETVSFNFESLNLKY